ncbi:porin [Neisseria sp. N95_16]|uniref:Porin n=1 Tax=Neisseria brasiliensis TaxID=2666100 RepID=A0A5Q3RVH8_9NEIS|nr:MULTISPECIES: porin [Neisseria]MRN37139.1 porin [Neisseria brasiliensis]PJO10409.1 porin [Neisseria sp. N95_16]PJO77318.1 porin [Neisseria sp. N177_16]QGL24149.1 porin [Neisseria brasiliensis]
MNKTALTFLLSAAIALPAGAATVFESDETGTKIDFVGSARIKWETTADKETDVRKGEVTKESKNHPITNNGSRFGFKAKQSLGHDDLYALGRVEWRFRGKDSNGVDRPSNHDFDHIYTRQLYGGIGHKRYGELTYGNQTVITDDVKQTDLANTLSLSDGLLASGARRSVQYKYENKEQGIKTGVFYGGRSPRGNDGLSETRKDIIGAGLVKTFEVNDGDEWNVGLGATREHYRQEEPVDYVRTAYAFGTAYTFDDTTVGIDIERRIRKDEEEAGYKRTNNEIRTAIYHKLTSDWRAYGMYAYKTEKRDQVSSSDRKEKQHQFMVGTEYYLIPKGELIDVKTFAEVQTTRSKQYRNGELRSKERNYTTVVGLRASW